MDPSKLNNARVVVPGAVVHVPGWLPSDRTGGLAARIVDETFDRWSLQLKHGKGRPYMDRGHHMARFGDANVAYDYKGKPKPVYPWTPSLVEVRDLVAQGGWVPNCVVVNCYASGSGLYPHRDSRYIPQLGARPTIVSVGFGAARTFRFHPLGANGKRLKEGTIDIVLGDGDLLVMHGPCDEEWHHSIPDEPGAGADHRLSLTFRKHII